jgi:hypothetical protein
MSGHFFYTSVVVPATVVVPLVMGLLVYKRLKRPELIIFYYLVFAGFVDTVAAYTAEHRINNLWMLHVYTAVEAVVLLWFYRSTIRNAHLKRIIPFLMVLFPLICMANILWWQSLKSYNTYTRPVEALLLIYFGLVCFFEDNRTVFWFNAGVLLYFSASFFIFIFSNYLHPGQFFNTVIQVSHATFVLIMYLLFTVGFYTCRR